MSRIANVPTIYGRAEIVFELDDITFGVYRDEPGLAYYMLTTEKITDAQHKRALEIADRAFAMMRRHLMYSMLATARR